MAAQASEESNDRTSASAEGEEKWTHVIRIDEELKRVAENMARIEGAGGRVAMPTIMRAPHAFREHGEFGYEFRYDPVCMRLGLYNRGALLVPTAAETRRMEAAIAFVNTLNKRRVELRLSPIDWHEMCARVVPSPARVRQLWSDAPSDMTDDDVRHLLAIDAVFMLCFFQRFHKSLRRKFPQVQALDWNEATIWKQQGIMQDFLLMENQIPLVLIQNALALALEGEHREHAEPDRVINPSSDLVCAKDFHTEVHKLLFSVLQSVLNRAGLWRFYDSDVPKDVIVSSDHLLDLVYRVVAKKYRIPDVDADENPRPGSNSTRSVGALIRCGEKSAYFFQKLMIYLRHLQCVLPTRLVAAFGSRSQDCQEEEYLKLIPTASKLRKAGIAVKGLKDATIWDYKTEQGLFTDTLWIPKLEIWDSTANSLRNLLLIEMRSQCKEQPLMEYLLILVQLVDTREDVAILCGNTNDYVILNAVGDAGNVAKLINDLDRGCEFRRYSRRLREFCKEVRQCCNRRRKRWLWQFVETYLNKPWKIASLLGAVFLLALTALQTIYSMLSFYGIQTLSD